MTVLKGTLMRLRLNLVWPSNVKVVLKLGVPAGFGLARDYTEEGQLSLHPVPHPPVSQNLRPPELCSAASAAEATLAER